MLRAGLTQRSLEQLAEQPEGLLAQGHDWREAAMVGGITGGLAGYLSAGMYFDHSINTASNIKTKCLFLMLEITVIGQVSLALSV